MSNKAKEERRLRLKLRLRKKIRGTEEMPRLSVFKSVKHTYAQIITDDKQKTLVTASTLDKEVKEALSLVEAKGSKSLKSVAAAKAVGMVIARRGLEKNIKKVVFDRNGFKYGGRIQAVADGAREGGFEF